MTLKCVCSIDTVVLWDWIISLPREWQYVNTFVPAHLYNSRRYLADLEDVLDSSQSGVLVLPVRRFKNFQRRSLKYPQVLGHYSRTLPALCLRQQSQP
jgi:hypothetical protein